MKEEEKAEGSQNVNEDYYLSENDIIRLGNFKFILREYI